MAIRLPKPIADYFASENTHEASGLEAFLAADATIRDEGNTYRGLDAIGAWRAETARKYSHTVEPLAVSERDGKTIVTCKVSGNFPGSPIELRHVFRIENDKVVDLKIG